MTAVMRKRNMVHLFNCLNAALPSSPFFSLRRTLLRLCGIQVGRTVQINTRVSFYWHNVVIGEHTWIGPECGFCSTAEAGIHIGENCDIAPRVVFVTGTHEIGDSHRRAGEGKSLPIWVGDGCWIGVCSIILGGARIGNGCVVAAGAVVLGGEYADNSLIAGVPAQIKRTLA